MTAFGLVLRGFGVAFGDQTILDDITLELPAVGMTVVVGPAGGGKSTLVRTLAGLNACQPSLTTWGTVQLAEPGRRPALVVQHARFFLDSVRENLVSALPDRSSLVRAEQTQVVTARLAQAGLDELIGELGRDAVELPARLQRQLALGRALMTEPGVLFVDEPTVGLDDRDAAELIALLRRQAARRAVLFVTHNQRWALAAGGTTVLIGGGRVLDRAPTDAFFAQPATDSARHFLRTGGYTPAAGVPVPRSRFVGPRGFFWVEQGRLGGMPRPGIIDELAHDLEGLQRLGVTLLVTLEETATVAPAALAAAGVRSVHFPIPDMGVVDVASTAALCRRLRAAIDAGEVVAVHCRAGLGRTGTILASQLIADGSTARDAIDVLRAINPRCIQSAAQVEFLRSFSTSFGRGEPRTNPESKQERSE